MQTDICILDADYVDIKKSDGDNNYNEARIRIFGITRDGKKVMAYDDDFYPYMYCVPKFNLEQTKKYIERVRENEFGVKRVEVVEKTLPGGSKRKEVLKIYGYHPSDLSKIRDFIKNMDTVNKDRIYEYSINFYRKYLIDKGIQPGTRCIVLGDEKENDKYDLVLEIENITQGTDKSYIDQNILAFDIETLDDSIIMISFKSENYTKVLTYKQDGFDKNVEVLQNEKELIQRFVEIINETDPDIITTYNGDQFDFSVLQKRAERYDIDMNIGRYGHSLVFEKRANSSAARVPGRQHIDLYSFVDKILSSHLKTEVLSLNDVAKEIIDKGKLDYTHYQMKEDWRADKNVSKMAEYCLNDSVITLQLAEELVPQIFELSKLTNQLPYDTARMTYGQLVEWYLLKRAYPDIISPSRPIYDEINERRKHSHFEGGFVKEPKPGIYNNIYVLDFQSLYPTIIVSYNISPDTLNVENCNKKVEVPGKKIFFCKDRLGFVPDITGELIQKRVSIKDKMDNLEEDSATYKHYDNKQYALKILANSIYGYYGYVGARWYSKECAESITSLGRKWIKEVMDMAVDSGHELIYGDTDSLMITGENIEQFVQEVNNKLPGIMKLELEGFFRRGIFVKESKGRGAKKRYALVDTNNKLKIRGFETVRRDWSPLAKQLQREIISKILVDSDTDEAIEYAKRTIKKISEKEIKLDQFIIKTKLTKPLDEYKSRSPHVSAAEDLKERGQEIKPGMLINYVITKGDGSISDRAKPVSAVNLDDIDTEYYIEKQIIPVALRVLQVLGVDRKELLGKGRQKGLEGFA